MGDNLLWLTLIAYTAMNTGLITVANAQDVGSKNVTVADLMAVTCDQLLVMLQGSIESLDVIEDLRILMGYSYYRQDCWVQHYPACKHTVKQQSPINIDTNKVNFYNFPPLSLGNANVSIDYGMMGHLIKIGQFRVTEDVIPSISGGPISAGTTLPFFAMFFFTDNDDKHTGPKSRGSLHAINGQKYAAELMLVWTQQKTTKMTEMLNHTVGDVLGTSFLIQIQDQDNPAWEALMMPFARGSACPIIPQDFAHFRYSSLLSLLPSTDDWLDHYYTYDGSAVAPPCTDVKFIVFADPIYVSQDQLSTLQSLQDENGMQIKNIRDVQPVQKSTKVYSTIGCHKP